MTKAVFARLWRQERRQKKQIPFLLVCTGLVGGLLPLFTSDVRTLRLAVLGVCILFVNLNAACLYAEEKDKKTLETLLSSPVTPAGLVGGAFCFYYALLAGFSLLTLALQQLLAPGGAAGFMLLLYPLVLAYLLYTALVISLTSDYAMQANKRMSPRSLLHLGLYSAGLILYQSQNWTAFWALVLPYTLYLIGSLLLQLLLQKKRLSRERILQGRRKKTRAHSLREDKGRHAGLIGAIFRHEYKLVRTYSLLKSHLLAMFFIPALMLYGAYTFAEYRSFGLFTWPLAICLLLVLRVPTNFISISIGGEKAYKTFETLLSAPVPLGPLFIGKMLPSVLVSSFILIGSALITLVTANVLPLVQGKAFQLVLYTPAQWILILGAGLQLTLLMVFITGYLSLSSKSPRAGLWIASFATLLPAAPFIALLIFAPGSVLAALALTLAVAGLNIFCFAVILKKIDRKTLLEKI